MKKLLTLILSLASLSAFAQVYTGIDMLERYGFEELRGKRVGLVTNPSGVDRNLRSTIDILFEAPEVNLVALYGPEHGVRGDAYAGDHVASGKDPKTGLPVHSLYGSTRKPTPEMLKGVDVMVYDIQDVGTRSYTFISTLGLVMRACAEQDVEVMVLDRPNPLGGLKVEGCLVEPGFFSFVSEFRIPYVYGLTVGELAGLINEEGLNCGVEGKEPPLKCRLTVIPMRGWERSMLYKDTGLPWILPSPNIPSEASAIGYPSAGIAGEYGYLNIGVGYTIPFQTFAAPWIDADKLKERLDSYGLPGTAFYGLRGRDHHADPVLRDAGPPGNVPCTQSLQGFEENPHARYRLWHGLCEKGIRKATESRRYPVQMDAGYGRFQGALPKLLLISLTFKRQSHEKDDQHRSRPLHHDSDDCGP